MPADDLRWALSTYKTSPSLRLLMLACEYYDGKHRYRYATDRMRNQFGALFNEFADNLCPAVVDSLAERLKIIGWRTSAAQVDIEPVEIPDALKLPGIAPRMKVTVNDPMAVAADELWIDNEMEARAAEVHENAIKMGNAYILVWPGPDMEAQFWPQTDLEFSVEYDANRLGIISRACKLWYLPGEERWRLNVYLLSGIEKYITRGKNPNGVPTDDNKWQRFADPDTGSFVPNPYGIVPAFHFSNGGLYRGGATELKDSIPIQDALNKSITDMLIAMEFASYKQRYIIGMEPEIDETTGEPTDANVRGYGVDRMMAIPGGKDEVSVGQFEATDLSQFRMVSNDFRAEMSRVSGTPLHYFFITTGDFPSGEAIKSAEARFVRKIERRQEYWTPIWGKAVRFGLSIENTLDEELQVFPMWEDASPRSDSEKADTAVKKKAIGVSRSVLLKEMGYDDDEIDRMLAESDAYDATKASLEAEGRGPDIPPAGAGGGTGTAVNAATGARQQGRVPGVPR